MVIKDWPDDDRPREKLLKNGEHTLSDAELLALLLRTGVAGKSALDLARTILAKFGSFRKMSHTDPGDWNDMKGLGPAKLCQIKAAMEIARRYDVEPSPIAMKIERPADIFAHYRLRMRDLKHEIFKVCCLDSRNRVIHEFEAEEGSVNHAYPIIRQIFQTALAKFSSGIVCIHNHPSGDPSPSREDRQFTKTICDAGKVLTINVVDHVIVGDNTFYSFADHGALG